MEDVTQQPIMQTLTISNIASFEQCISELIANSLNSRAAAIAVRIHAGKRKIQVVDNGVGIPKDMLRCIAEAEATDDQQQVCELPQSNYLADIRRLSDCLTIASRYQYSKETFMKAFEMGFASNLIPIEQRPSCGTTVSVYGFYEIPCKKWDTSIICFLIAAIAVTKLEVSFSIRDEEQKKVVLRIAKPHSPVEVLKTLFGKDLPLNHVWSIQCSPECNTNYHGYVGLSDKNAMQWIFLNHRPIYCPLILKLIQIAFKERFNLSSNALDLCEKNIFILFFLTFSEKEFTFVIENEKRCIMFYDMQKILNPIKNCIFKSLAEEATVSAITPYLCKTQMLKRIHLRREKSIFNNINGRKNVTFSIIKNKIVTIGFKKRNITSTIVSSNYFNKQHNTDDNIETVKHYIDKKHNILSNIHQTKVTIKHMNLCVDDGIKKMHNNNDETQGSSRNLRITDNLVKSDEVSNYRNDNSNNFVNMISPLSEWSNWTYYTNNKKRDSTRNMIDIHPKIDMHQFNVLPRKLYGFLQHRHVKLTNVKSFDSPNDTILFTENWQHEQAMVHPCKLKQKLCEFRLSRESLKYIKVINQVNDEFIAALMTYNKMKILLMIDQHAVHERIRYENLLLRYKVQNESELLSFNLRDPLSMEFPTEMYNLLLRNKTLLKKYGINLGSSKENTLLIRTIPQCLVTNSDSYNNEKILPKIYGLLNDVLKNRDITNQANALPLTIHNAIASEACHGAIKFGDKLILEQCKSLIKLLKLTKFPNRCAHGRPTIIPVMEFSELRTRSVRILEEKLNFTSLKKITSIK
ncbi:DNA mismatch repair protein Mlh3 [Solenopsis invicta]|uniref:DNA mismatch repair protein Mlh3 n=1 Tax=Solenopsis invicta TaxID=13686 RepID=UPI00193D66FD|nr:DNA mismatch repair protein Mlh3 [Solenopsis invicta]